MHPTKNFKPRWTQDSSSTDVWFGRVADDLPVHHVLPLSRKVFASYTGPEKGLTVVEEMMQAVGTEEKTKHSEKTAGKNKNSVGTPTPPKTTTPPPPSTSIPGCKGWSLKNRKAYGISMSLYDQHPITAKITGDPLADCFGICGVENGSVMVVADGVNWGEASRLAARCAVYGAMKCIHKRLFGADDDGDDVHDDDDDDGHVGEERRAVSTTKDVFALLMSSLEQAHNTIISMGGGLTTLCVCVVCPVVSSPFSTPISPPSSSTPISPLPSSNPISPLPLSQKPQSLSSSAVTPTPKQSFFSYVPSTTSPSSLPPQTLSYPSPTSSFLPSIPSHPPSTPPTTLTQSPSIVDHIANGDYDDDGGGGEEGREGVLKHHHGAVNGEEVFKQPNGFSHQFASSSSLPSSLSSPSSLSLSSPPSLSLSSSTTQSSQSSKLQAKPSFIHPLSPSFTTTPTPTTTLPTPTTPTDTPTTPTTTPSHSYVACVVNVGDSLAFVFSRRHGVREITTGSHDVTLHRDLRDAGGALGPVREGGRPELNNLTCSQTFVQPGDVVFLATDGITDNFDPVVTKIAVAKKFKQKKEMKEFVKGKDFKDGGGGDGGVDDGGGDDAGGGGGDDGVIVEVRGANDDEVKEDEMFEIVENDGNGETDGKKEKMVEIKEETDELRKEEKNECNEKEEEDGGKEGKVDGVDECSDGKNESFECKKYEDSRNGNDDSHVNNNNNNEKGEEKTESKNKHNKINTTTTNNINNKQNGGGDDDDTDADDDDAELGLVDGKPVLLPYERHRYAIKEMERILHEYELMTESSCSAQELCGALLHHVLVLTDPKRKVLENPELYRRGGGGGGGGGGGSKRKRMTEQEKTDRDKRIASQLALSPGKLDHATIIGFEVGCYHGNEDEDYEE